MAYWTKEAYEIGKKNAMTKPKTDRAAVNRKPEKIPEKAEKRAGSRKENAGKRKPEAKAPEKKPETWVIEKEMDGQAYVLTDVSRDWSGCITYSYRQKTIDNAALARVFTNEEKAREIAEKVRGTVTPARGVTEMSSAEAAAWLGIHQTVFNYHVRKLGIRAESVGHRHMYQAEDVRRVLEDLRREKRRAREKEETA